MIASGAQAPPARARNPWLVTIAVTLATFMEVLDISVANVALPHIAGNLSASVEDATWILTSYLVSNAIVLPLSGWASSVLGRKRFYLGCVVVFSVSSLLCGLAPSLETLIVFRILQGLGGGGLQPTAQAVLIDAFPPERRGLGMAAYGITVIVAPIIGPFLGGWITDHFSWRWIFLINVPVGVLAFSLASALVSDPPWMKRKPLRENHVDAIGLTLLVIGIGALQLMLDTGQRNDWFSSTRIIACAVIAGLCLPGLVAWCLRRKDPIVDFRLLGYGGFASATVAMFTLGFVLFGSTLLMPLFLQTMLGYSATDSGMAMSPGGMVTMVTMPVVGILLSKVRVDPRLLVVLGLALGTVSLYLMTRWSPEVDFRTAVDARMVLGAGLAFLFIPINTAAYSFIPKERSNYASGLLNLARNLGGSCGIAFVTTLLERHSQTHQQVLVAHLTPYDQAFREQLAGMTRLLHAQGASLVDAGSQAYAVMYGQLLRQARFLAFVDTFWTLTLIFGAVIPLVYFMKARAATTPAPVPPASPVPATEPPPASAPEH